MSCSLFLVCSINVIADNGLRKKDNDENLIVQLQDNDFLRPKHFAPSTRMFRMVTHNSGEHMRLNNIIDQLTLQY